MDQAGALLGSLAAVLALSGTLIDDRLAVGLLAVVATEADSLAIDLDRDLGVGGLAADRTFAGFFSRGHATVNQEQSNGNNR